MEIIKPGYIDKSICSGVKQFECDRCGCIWQAKRGEYKITSQIAFINDGMKQYNMQCPYCGKIIDIN